MLALASKAVPNRPSQCYFDACPRPTVSNPGREQNHGLGPPRRCALGGVKSWVLQHPLLRSPWAQCGCCWRFGVAMGSGKVDDAAEGVQVPVRWSWRRLNWARCCGNKRTRTTQVRVNSETITCSAAVWGVLPASIRPACTEPTSGVRGQVLGVLKRHRDDGVGSLMQCRSQSMPRPRYVRQQLCH